MTKKILKKTVVYISAIAIIIIFLQAFIFHPKAIADAVIEGLRLCAEKVIPSLFPFMVFSSVISKTALFHNISRRAEKITQKILRISGIGFSSVVLGFLGGYPVGAKNVYDLYNKKLISENEARRLFCWCSNPSPAFVISAVGVFMLSSYKSGIILYASTLLSAFVIGFVSRFFADNTHTYEKRPQFLQPKSIFTDSVAETGEAMLGICGWLLTFCSIISVIELYTTQNSSVILIKSIAEVTSGCQNAADNNLSLPLIAAVLGFGGFAVIFQIAGYMKAIGLPMKHFVCTKILNGALNAFFCSVLMKIFPQVTPAAANISVGKHIFPISNTIITAVILLIMCTVFILEVDNKKKLC